MPNRSDAQLIADYLKGDGKSLEVLFGRYLKPIYGFVYRYFGDEHSSADATQEVFLKVWRNLRKFDQNKNFRAWVFRIAKNACLDELKKKKAAPFSMLGDGEENIFEETIIDPAPLPDEIFDRAVLAEILKRAMSRLVEKYRKILSLRYYESLTFREIAAVLGEPLHTVKSRHRRALIRLQKILS